MTCSEEEKIQWFKDTIGSTIGKITLTGDRVEEIILVDELYDVAAEALSNMSLPADFPDQPNIPREQLEKDFALYCKQIMLRTATVEQLAVGDDVSPELIFIRPVTSRMKFQGFLDHWDKSIGFSEGLQRMQCPFEYSPDEKKMLFGFAHLMNCMAMQSRQMMANAPAGNPDMFKMD